MSAKASGTKMKVMSTMKNLMRSENNAWDARVIISTTQNSYFPQNQNYFSSIKLNNYLPLKKNGESFTNFTILLCQSRVTNQIIS